MTIFLFALREHLKSRLILAMLLVFPLVLLFIPSLPDSLPMALSLFGLLDFYSAFLLSRLIVEDRMRSVVVRIAAAPISHLQYLANHLCASLALLVVQNVVFVVAARVVYGNSLTNWGVLLVVYLCYAIMTLSFSLAWNSLFRSYAVSFSLFSGLGSIMCLVSGLSFPLRFLPPNLQKAVRILPTYWLAHALDALYHTDRAAIALACLVLGAYSAIFLLLGSKRRL
ncbi:MAG: ABC transporter permease [Sphaerochaeta sp.]|jgi:ABC-2 type transport system permease protein|uniref:ABC transporter permease n=1 Tax=Sphaerochaeta sp. TaxID=1972642 RepID=UPI003D1326D2